VHQVAPSTDTLLPIQCLFIETLWLIIRKNML
jgi:hypothetical protein